MDLKTFTARQKEKEDRMEKLDIDNIDLSTMVLEMINALEWCKETFPELQEGGEYADCWQSIDRLIGIAGKRAKKYTNRGPFQQE